MNYPICWNLNTLGAEPGTAEFRHGLESLKTTFRSLADRLKDPGISVESADPVRLRGLIDDFSQARAQWHQAQSLLECYQAEQAANAAYRTACGALSAIKPDLERVEHLLDHLLKTLPADRLQDWLDQPGLSEVRDFVERRLREARLQLPAELADFAGEMNVNGQHAWSRLYDLLSGSVRITIMEKGELVQKSPGQIAFDSPERSQRENNFLAAQRAWTSIAEPCAAALNHLIGSRLTQDRYARRESFLSVPLMQNRVTFKAVSAMWQAIEIHKSRLAEYLLAKQQLLGLTELCWFDLDAPLQASATGLNYPLGCDTILRAFAEFHPPLHDFAEMAFREAWIEAEDRSGKRQGGFCTDFPISGETRIFMTYRNTEDSLSTLAHELGHAYHSWQLRDKPYVAQSYPMTLAETASTFAETIVAEQRLQTVTDSRERLATLDRLLGDAVTFLMNIHCRWLFDNEVHRIRQDRELDAAELSNLMVRSQQTAYHGVLAEHGCNPTFWISKLHFYMSDEPFYNFPYTFGYLLSQRLYLEARQSPGDFPRRYDEFLARTTSACALAAARDSFGFDLESTSFWQEALQPILERITAFQDLV